MTWWRQRYAVVSVLFLVWVTSCLDRMVMATAIPYMADDFGLKPVTMGVVMSAFFIGYALCRYREVYWLTALVAGRSCY